MGARPSYAEAVAALGAAIVENGQDVIYGGGGLGLMGVLADAALAKGGRVTGIIPKHLMRAEIAHSGLSEMHVVAGMHERKGLMADLSDAFIAAPGGIGTMEELFEIWSWGQLGLHAKPLGFLDVDGYFGTLHHFLDHMTAEGFIRPHHRAMVFIDNDPKRLLDSLRQYQAPQALG